MADRNKTKTEINLEEKIIFFCTVKFCLFLKRRSFFHGKWTLKENHFVSYAEITLIKASFAVFRPRCKQT